ncbi:MAG: helix-turn-helix domain-containing protein [Melioribacter sp.]|nr:helix-turn-helix domain-containing protein [Melioribacter sp.]
MASEALKKFADELKFTREQKGITLQQISAQTKIDIKFLQQIEEGYFEFLPEIYVRAFIKEYAQSINLDPDEVISNYNLAKGEIKETDEKRPFQRKKDANLFYDSTVPSKMEFTKAGYEEYGSTTLVDTKKNSNFKNLLSRKTILIASLLILILIFSYLIFIKSDTESVIEEVPYKDIQTERYKVDTAKSQNNFFENSDSLILSILPLNNVWLKVLSDNKEILEKTVQSNQQLNIKALKEFYIVVGDAGSIKMSLNNKPITQLGNAGEIRRYIISRDTIKSYLIPIQKKNEEGPSKEN